MEQPLYAEALLQQGGVIRAAGPLEALAAMAPGAKRVNLAGRALLPAFIDAHSHFSGYANALLQVRLEGAQSYEDICEKIRRFICENNIPAGQWVMARGYDHNALREKRPPHKSLLDEAAPACAAACLRPHRCVQHTGSAGAWRAAGHARPGRRRHWGGKR